EVRAKPIDGVDRPGRVNCANREVGQVGELGCDQSRDKIRVDANFLRVHPLTGLRASGWRSCHTAPRYAHSTLGVEFPAWSGHLYQPKRSERHSARFSPLPPLFSMDD